MRVTDEMVNAARSAYSVDRIPNGEIINKIAGPGYGDKLIRGIIESALSHAAGQDGEQCRAASGDREAMATRLRELICEYWDLAYDEGVDKRNSDTPAGDANRVANEIETIIRALSRGVPEGMVLVPRKMTPEMMKAVQVHSEVGAYICGSWIGAYDCIQELWNVAIAAQRKEGE